MAVRTYAQLISDISTYLTQKVTIAKHSTLATNIVDTLFNSGNGSGARPYKVYTALLTQTSTNAPVATVLENTLGGTVVWAYGGAGAYTFTLASAFTANKTAIFIGLNHPVAGSQIRTLINSVNDGSLATDELQGGGWVAVDEKLQTTPIEIRVYP